MTKRCFLPFVLVVFCFCSALAQNNITKTAGVNYTNGPPTFNPSQKTGSEYAIDTSNGRFYQLHRTSATSGTWLLLAQGIDTIGTSVAPTYAPTRNKSWFVINAVDSLYRYSGAGVVWNCINCGGGGGAPITSVSATAPAAGFTITGSPITAPGGTFVFTLANDLAALEALATTGIPARTSADTWVLRNIVAGTGAITVTNGDGVAGNPTFNNTDPDQSTTNEIQTYSHAGGATYTNTLSSGGGSWSITGAGINVTSQVAGAITVTGTEVDGSITNELQTIANTSNATSHTATLSNTGGSLQFVEGAGITLTTTGTGLDGIVTIASSLSNFYQQWRDDGVDKTQRANANFVSSVRIAMTLTDDAPNTETEVSADLVLNSVADAYLSQRGALTVMGRAVNSTGNVADIVSTADGQVLRRNGTTLDWGQVGTTWLADQAATYAKMQNAVANNVLLGNNNGANTSFEEINAAAAQTMLGFIDGAGANQRIAYFTDANTLAAEAAFLYDAANDRQTIISTTPALGIGVAILNLQNAGNDPSGEALRADGNITGNWLMGISNSATGATTNNTIVYSSQAGNGAGDPIFQFNITGAGGNSGVIGLDNSDINKLKISPNTTTPGGNANASLVGTMDAIPLWGINKDAPAFPFDVGGKERSEQYHGINVAWVTGDVFFGLGAGTGPTFTSLTGTHNFVRLAFSTGTAPTANNAVVTIQRKAAFQFAAKGFSVFSAGNAAAAGEITKFYVSSDNGIDVTVTANGTLTASTAYVLYYGWSGY